MKRIAVLGSTGSIGRNTLEVIERFPRHFKVVGLSANANIDLLSRQIEKFRPDFVSVSDTDAAYKLKTRSVFRKIRVFAGQDGLLEMVKEPVIDEVMMAISGSAALVPLLKSIEHKKEIALANKEALVMAGQIIMRKAVLNRVKIIPVDSEQSAIRQCLDGRPGHKINKVYLTASGGPLRKCSKSQLENITVSQALRHPCWKMGKKISVDSATLMNKGLEVIEAMHLFSLGSDKIKIIVHPEAVIHSMVEFQDGVVLAQMSVTDMRIPIQYSLSYPERLRSAFGKIDFYGLKKFSFGQPDFARFPCLGLAYDAAKKSGTMPCVLNAANEISVRAFLKNRLRFVYIPRVIEKVMHKHRNINKPGLTDILQADTWARQEADGIIAGLN